MATYEDLIPDVMPEAPGCPTAIVQRHLRDTLRHFCRESWFWKENLKPITLLPFTEGAIGTYVYDLTEALAEPADVVGVDHLMYKGSLLASGSMGAMDSCVNGWRQQIGETPRMYVMTGPRHVRFVPASDRAQAIAITGRVVVMPAMTANSFGDDLLNFNDALAAGALARLQKMANKEWSDRESAEINQSLYEDGLSLAKLEAMRDYTTQPTLNPISLVGTTTS